MPTGLTFNAKVDLMAAILEARTDAKLLDVTTLAAQKAGFDSVLIGLQWKTLQGEMRFKVTSGYPEGWQQKYLERSYMTTDPTVAHCQVVTAPWVWSEPFFQAHHSMALLEEAKSFGVGYGVSVPTHERLGVKSMVSFARHAPFSPDSREERQLLSAATVISQCAHVAHRNLSQEEMVGAPSRPLSLQEGRCLRWIATGKTSWEIGTILGISETTAVFHIKNVMAKLGVSNRTQAIAVAFRTGLLD